MRWRHRRRRTESRGHQCSVGITRESCKGVRCMWGRKRSSWWGIGIWILVNIAWRRIHARVWLQVRPAVHLRHKWGGVVGAGEGEKEVGGSKVCWVLRAHDVVVVLEEQLYLEVCCVKDVLVYLRRERWRQEVGTVRKAHQGFSGGGCLFARWRPGYSRNVQAVEVNVQTRAEFKGLP
ncbi:hypothetical protein C8R44DRAFT_747127 [Mycena epipterygia]|nr:hypothetical protein C8R44DRAFT_747127 [Mycena epipterygia]